MKSCFLLLVLLSACNKQPQCPPYVGPTIEGHWETIQPKTPAWNYDIFYGSLRKYVRIGNTDVVSFNFKYSFRNDTLILTDSGAVVNMYKYRFVLDSLAELQDITPGVQLAPLSLIIKQ